MFWLHDAYHDGHGFSAWTRRWPGTIMAVLTVVAGLFICIAGLYVNIKAIVDAYVSRLVTSITCGKNVFADFCCFNQGLWSYHRAVHLLAACKCLHRLA